MYSEEISEGEEPGDNGSVIVIMGHRSCFDSDGWDGVWRQIFLRHLLLGILIGEEGSGLL